MPKTPELPPDPQDPTVRIIIAEARMNALYNLAAWLAADLARLGPDHQARAVMLADMVSRGAGDHTPFRVDYDAAGNPATIDIAIDGKPLPLARQRAIRSAAVDAIRNDAQSVRQTALNPPPLYEDD